MSDHSGAAPSRPASGVRGPAMGRGMGHGPGSVRIENAKDFRGAMRRLVRYFGPQALLIGLSALIIIASVALKTLAPALIGKAIHQDLEIAKNLPAFLRSIVLLLGIYLASWAADSISGIMLVRMGNSIVYRLRRDAFDKVQKLPMSYFDERGIGDLISRLTNDIEMIYNALSQSFSNLVSGFFSMVGVLIAMFVLNIPLTLFMLLTVPAIALIAGMLGKRIREAFKKNQENVGALSASIEESVSGVRVIQSFRREDAEFAKFERVSASARDVGARAEVVSAVMMPLMQIMTSLSLAVVSGVGGWLILRNWTGFSIGLLASFILYTRSFFQPLMQITNVYNVMQSAMAGAERVFQVLDEKEEPALAPGGTRAAGEVDAERLSGAVEFRSLSFRYVPDKSVLESISFKAEQGSIVAIVGPTGAGKTTLVNLLSRFYEPNSGSIAIGGRDIRDIEINFLRRRMGVVLQEPFFFAMSIRDNLLYARSGATEAEMIEAARKANADHFVRRLSGGYDTVLTERGLNLSQGERQLLAIARAILADPDILILDEATSSVDSLTETRIQAGLTELMKGRTSFVIAHRLSTIRNADKVIVMHEHRVIEEGTHDELMERGGLYARLYRMQKTMDEVTEESVG
jgi:ATP-binding cassette subfamily B multidrug efflux pump